MILPSEKIYASSQTQVLIHLPKLLQTKAMFSSQVMDLGH